MYHCYPSILINIFPLSKKGLEGHGGVTKDMERALGVPEAWRAINCLSFGKKLRYITNVVCCHDYSCHHAQNDKMIVEDESDQPANLFSRMHQPASLISWNLLSI
jgi:hypothetical protein